MLGWISSYTDSLVSLAEIIGVNVVLSGGNAVVIALAARELPISQQQKAIIGGSAAVIVMRLALTFVAVALLESAYVKVIGSALLFWIGVKLLDTDDKEGASEVAASSNLVSAIRTILVADMIMSLDNVLAVAAAAKGNAVMLIVGLATSIPIVILGAKILIQLIGRFPIIITMGGALIGYTAGEMAVTDLAVNGWVDANFHVLHQITSILFAVSIVVIGRAVSGKRRAASDRASVAE